MPKINNFDLIRLFAALQVAVNHGVLHLRVPVSHSWLLSITDYFPGVPIFFFVSGFLISRSYQNNPVAREFFLNRILRIYPGLAVCFVLSVITVWWTGYFDRFPFRPSEAFAWTVAQLSFAQFYNPEALRHYGVGVLNGSLWTITVELQFYVLLPIGYWLLRIGRAGHTRSNLGLTAAIVVFALVNRAFESAGVTHGGSLWYKLIGVSFMPWIYMFLIGVLYQRNFTAINRQLSGRGIGLLGIYLVGCYVAATLLDWRFGNSINPIMFIALGSVTFAIAFSGRELSDRVLRRNDVSYGVYIYHMPVINFCLAYVGLYGTPYALIVAVVATLVTAFLSWRLVERPMLGLKRNPLYRHDRVVKRAIVSEA